MTQSVYSLLQSTLTINQLVESAKSKGFKAIALTDNKTMFGIMAFVLTCQKHGIKPIVGVQLEFVYNEQPAPFVLLANNIHGYRNLNYLTTLINQEPYALTIDQVKQYQENTTMILFGEGGFFEQAMMDFDKNTLEKQLVDFKEHLGSFYVALSMNESQYWKEKNEFLYDVALANDIQCTALSKVYYNEPDDAKTLRTLEAMRLSKSVSDPALIQQNHRHLLSVEEMQKLYQQEVLQTTDAIANAIETYELKQLTTLPQFQSNLPVDNKTYLRELCHVGLRKRFPSMDDLSVYKKRLDHELAVITSMNYEDYFLIVFDIIRFAKMENIAVGPGRGSAAGSLVSYCLGITHVDPLEYGLLFERFLNPERVSMPDIDIDFSDKRREEIIHYVYEKYGHYHVAHIITFGTLKAKMSLRDVAKVHDVPLRIVDGLIKRIPSKLNITLAQAYEQSSSFAKMVNENEKLRQVFDMALKIENFPRHASTHAAGVVLSREPLPNVLPLIHIEDEMLSTQYTMEYLENLGLIKMDFLGLRNLSIIDEVVTQISNDFDLLKIPMDDEKTFQLVKKGDTVGIFQLESEGMKRLLLQMKPTRFDDIVATIALYRPGPMENIPAYLEAKNKNQTRFDVHPLLAPIVADTYGILIYQEQIIQAVVALANFSLAKADHLRKAISKKNTSDFNHLRQDFINGAKSNNINHQEAIELFDLIGKFANYGFNKSHAVAYGLISYQMAYLKANYPLLFYCALLNGVLGSESKTIEYFTEIRKKQIKLLPMSVKTSSDVYQIKGNGLLLPLSIIKGVGNVVVSNIIKERESGGAFNDFFDFIARMMMYRMSTKTFEALIYAGACDEFNLARLDMIATLDDAINYANLVKIETEGHVQIDLDLVSKPMILHVKKQAYLTLEKEKEMLGFYLSNHPIINLRDKINQPLTPLAILKDKQKHTVIVMIDNIKAIKTKTGEWMAFVMVSDDTATIDTIFWPSLYNEVKDTLNKGDIVLLTGNLDQKETFIVSTLKKVDAKEEK